mmetsp:Transcript_36976/g.93364  ORF Transcript_36976/g.93364 Transcript_36976/m.93364 type:complete len:1482 (-) Transcript_36976:452-4897(-)
MGGSNNSTRKPGALKPESQKLLNTLGTQDLVDAADTCKVVWAKVKGHPYWPAQVMSNKAAEEMMRGIHKLKEQSAPVQFFGTLEIAWMRDCDMVKWQHGMGSGYFHKGKTKRHFITSLEQVQTFLLRRRAPPGWWGKPPDKRVLPPSGATSVSTRRAASTLAEGSASNKQKAEEAAGKADRSRSRRESADDSGNDSRNRQRREAEETAAKASRSVPRLNAIKEQEIKHCDNEESPRRARRSVVVDIAQEAVEAVTPGRRTRRAIQAGVYHDEALQPNLDNPELLVSSRSSRAKRPKLQEGEEPDTELRDKRGAVKGEPASDKPLAGSGGGGEPEAVREASEAPEAAGSSANGTRSGAPEAADTFMSASNSAAAEAIEPAATAISSVVAEASMGSNDTAGGLDDQYGEPRGTHHRTMRYAGKEPVPGRQQGECHSKLGRDAMGAERPQAHEDNKAAEPAEPGVDGEGEVGHLGQPSRQQRREASRNLEGSNQINGVQPGGASVHDSTWHSEKGSVGCVDASISNGRVSRNGRVIKAPRKPGAFEDANASKQQGGGPSTKPDPEPAAKPATAVPRRRILTAGIPPQGGMKRRIIQMPGIPPAHRVRPSGISPAAMQPAHSLPATSFQREAERKSAGAQEPMVHANSAPAGDEKDASKGGTAPGPKKTAKQKLKDLPSDCHISPEDLDRDDLPEYEAIKRNVYLATDRPKRLPKSEVQVCSCAPTRDSAGTGLIGCSANCQNAAAFLTCDTRLCPCGLYCSNQPFALRPLPKLRVFHTGGARGWGVRAGQPIKRGTFIAEYVGEVINWGEVTRRLDSLRRSSGAASNGFYLMELEPGLYIDAREKGNVARLLNSSCEPNAETRKWRDAATGEVHVVVLARRDIGPGEEVTYDYQFERHGAGEAMGKYECLCGAENCRGTLDRQPERCKDHGRRLEVWWEADSSYYRGSVRGYNPRTRKHIILYDDNEEERVNLKEVPHRWLDDSAPMEPHPSGVAPHKPLSSGRIGAPIKKSGPRPSASAEDAAQGHSKLGFKLQQCRAKAEPASADDASLGARNNAGSGPLYGASFRKAAPPILSQRPVLPPKAPVPAASVEGARPVPVVPTITVKAEGGTRPEEADDDNMDDAAKSLVSMFHSPTASPVVPSQPPHLRRPSPSPSQGDAPAHQLAAAPGPSRLAGDREAGKAGAASAPSEPATRGAAPPTTATPTSNPASAVTTGATAGLIPVAPVPPPGWHGPPHAHLSHGPLGPPSGPPGAHLLNPHAIQQHILQQQIQQQVAALHAAGVHPGQITAALHAGLFQASGHSGGPPPGHPPGAVLVPQMMVGPGGPHGPPPGMHPPHPGAAAMSMGPDAAGSWAPSEALAMHFAQPPPFAAMPPHSQAEASRGVPPKTQQGQPPQQQQQQPKRPKTPPPPAHRDAVSAVATAPSQAAPVAGPPAGVTHPPPPRHATPPPEGPTSIEQAPPVAAKLPAPPTAVVWHGPAAPDN